MHSCVTIRTLTPSGSIDVFPTGSAITMIVCTQNVCNTQNKKHLNKRHCWTKPFMTAFFFGKHAAVWIASIHRCLHLWVLNQARSLRNLFLFLYAGQNACRIFGSSQWGTSVTTTAVIFDSYISTATEGCLKLFFAEIRREMSNFWCEQQWFAKKKKTAIWSLFALARSIIH